MNKDRPDFIDVRISDQAIALLGEDAAVAIQNAHMSYMFHGRTPVEVQRRGEWPLLRMEMFNDQPLFQEAEARAEAPVTTVPAATNCNPCEA